MARKILLADDSVTAQNMGRKILADAGYDVVTVNNGSAALKRITEVKPDLIVLDVYMPGYSGLEVCQRIKDAHETAHIPVLLTVGKLEPFKPEEARRVRADGHIVKPFEASELLTAITRLEDRMVPQSDGRFGTSVSGVERFGGDGGRKTENTDADTGWKSRLRFPSKKKKEEPEPESEDAAAAAPFREFRKTKGKAAANAPFAVKAPPPPGQEPGLVPDIPRDITPDELDALSALAAKLDGPIPAAENIVPLAEVGSAAQAAPDQAKSDQAKSKVASVEAVSTEGTTTEVPKTYAEILAAAAEAKKEKENKVEVASSTTAVESAAAPMEAPSLATAAGIGSINEIEIPVQQVEVAAMSVPEASATGIPPQEVLPVPPAQIQQSETHPAEIPVAAVTGDTAMLAQEPAPVDRNVDRNDAPIFTSDENAIEQAEPVEKVQEKIEQKTLEAAAQEKVEPSVTETTVVAKLDERPSGRSKEQQLPPPKTEELPAIAAQTEKSLTGELIGELKGETVQPGPVAVSAQESATSDELSPSDAELAQALRLLTPAGGSSDSATIPSHGTLVAAGQLLAEEALRNAASGPRWIAQPVALSPEETSISLEAEMFRAFMTVPPATVTSFELSGITGVSAIEATVENRLAAAELASAKVSSDQALEQAPSAPLPETAVAEAPAELAMAISAEADPQVEASESEKIKAETKAETIDAGKTEPENPEAEAKDSPATISEEETAPVAVASGQPAVEAAVASTDQPVSIAAEPATVAQTEENQDSISEVGSEESMAKDIKSKSGKSNWHQIRTAPAGAAADSNIVEAAKQAAGVHEEPAKAMAAVAAEGASSAAPDASTIASIVDSVMADLRPKIVEEIAKKLAGK